MDNATLTNSVLINFLACGSLDSVYNAVETEAEDIFAESVFNYLRENNEAKLLELSQNYVKEDIRNNGDY